MSKHWFTPLLILFFSSLGTANDVALIMGGGAESVGSDTRFDLGVMNSISAFKGMGYEVKVSFDGGHSETEQRITDTLSHKADSFSVKNYYKQLKEIERRLDNHNGSDSFKNGDKIVLLIDDHGKVNTDGNLVISTNDGTILLKDELLKLQKKAQAANVQLGVVVGTCYSGKIISALKENGKQNTCIIASSQPSEIGSRDFVQSFALNLKKNETLEDAYLKARANIEDVETENLHTSSSPVISTPEGLVVDKLMRELHVHMLSLTDIESQAERNRHSSDYCPVCEANLRRSSVNALRELMEQVKSKLNYCDAAFVMQPVTWQLLEVSDNVFGSHVSECSNLALLDKLGKLLDSYDKDAQRAANLTHELKEGVGKEVVYIYGTVPTPRYAIAIHDWENEAVGLGKSSDAFTRQCAQEKEAMEQKDHYRKLMTTAKEFDPESPLHKRLSKEALEMAEIERRLYTSFYKQEKQKNGNKRSACSDFKL